MSKKAPYQKKKPYQESKNGAFSRNLIKNLKATNEACLKIYLKNLKQLFKGVVQKFQKRLS